MGTDRQGLLIQGSNEAIEFINRGTDHLLRFQSEVVGDALGAAEADPTCAMAGVFTAYLSLMSTEGSAVSAARDALDGFVGDEATLSARERQHRAIANQWSAGDMIGAGVELDKLLIDYPRDVLALYVGHMIDFYTGNANNLRDRVGRALHAWPEDDPQSGFVRGMFSFGLEECNNYQRAEEYGLQAVELNADDVWGVHAVAHIYEMQGEIPKGIAYMKQRQDDWLQNNFLNVHNSWHFALYLLQGNLTEEALAIYDATLRNSASEDVAMEMVDASALLWRFQLEGIDVGDRWAPLAAAWKRSLEPGYYPFNDMHAAMAYVGSGDLSHGRELLSSMEKYVAGGNDGTAGWQMTSSVGVPVVGAIVAFGDANYEGVLDTLLPVRSTVNHFGGSHAQRDAVERTIIESALRAKRWNLAESLIGERSSTRGDDCYSWLKYEAIAQALGDEIGGQQAKRSLERAEKAIQLSS